MLYMKKKTLEFGVLYNLKPSLQCHRAGAKAIQVLRQIRRSFKITYMDILLFLYKMYSIWDIVFTGLMPFFSPKILTCLKKLRDVSPYFLMVYPNCPIRLYLTKLCFYSLYCGWQRGDLFEVYKILNWYYEINLSIYILYLKLTVTTIGHKFRLYK